MTAEHSIMIVDDDEDLLFLLKTQFQHAGFKTSTCLNGKGVITELVKKKYAVVFLDISMGSVSGEEICKKIRADKRIAGLKVVMMSGNVDIEKIASNCGADDYITKPLDIERVKEVLCESLQ